MTIGAERWFDQYKGDLVQLAIDIFDGKVKPDHHIEEIMTDTARWAAELRIKIREEVR